jgi:thiol-disulfide isomerase/thioredoxin
MAMAEDAASEGRVKSPLTIAFVVLAMLVGFAVLPRLFRPPQSALVGKDAPDFSLLVVLNGGDKPNLTLSELQGKPVILDFWATWCGPCQAEAPILDKIAQRYRDKGLVVVGVNTSDAPGRAKPWAWTHHISFPIVYDPDDVAPKYGVENLPTLVVVSKTGKVMAVRTGVTSDAELERLVAAAL